MKTFEASIRLRMVASELPTKQLEELEKTATDHRWEVLQAAVGEPSVVDLSDPEVAAKWMGSAA